VIKFVLSLADALCFRFTVSPLGEVVRLARAMANSQPSAQGAHVAWLREQQQPALLRLQHEHDLRPPLALLSARRDRFPGFLTPPPNTEVGDIDEELRRVLGTDPYQVAQEIGACLTNSRPIDADVERQLKADNALVVLSGLLDVHWQTLVHQTASAPRFRQASSAARIPALRPRSQAQARARSLLPPLRSRDSARSRREDHSEAWFWVTADR
jgi:hypothetical protein